MTDFKILALNLRGAAQILVKLGLTTILRESVLHIVNASGFLLFAEIMNRLLSGRCILPNENLS